jgi:hypothetical protein
MPSTPATVAPVEARVIAKEACIYGFPLVDNYRIQHSYFVDRAGPEFKAPWKALFNNARVYTPDDKAIQTPNSDTPYSYVGADLRAEPLVFTVPQVENGRYYSLQFIDMYTFNFAYVGSRATGNAEGRYLLAGPSWHGETPSGVNAVIRCETQFAFVLFRTQLFDPADIENVKKAQAGLQGPTALPIPRDSGAGAAACRFPDASQGRRGAYLAGVFHGLELPSAVLPDTSIRDRVDGAFREDRRRRGQFVRHHFSVS